MCARWPGGQARHGPANRAPTASSSSTNRKPDCMRLWIMAAAFLAAVGSARAETCDRQVFEHCQACHALTKDAGQKPGPQLVGVIGRPVAGDPAFDYSPVLKEARAKARSGRRTSSTS